jgi:hypothetical protein
VAIRQERPAEAKSNREQESGDDGLFRRREGSERHVRAPPDPARIDRARQAGKISLNPAGGAVNLIFADFVKPGDVMTVTFDIASKTIASFKRQHIHGRDKV